MHEVCFLTDPNHLDLPIDDQLFRDAARRLDIATRHLVWSAPHSWESFDALIIKSVSGYYQRMARFRRFLHSISQQLVINGVADVLWNADKRYLLDLQDRGVPIIPTIVVDSPKELRDLKVCWTADEWVVKPSISAAAHMTFRCRAGDVSEVARYSADIFRQTAAAVILQPLVPEISAIGEMSFVFLGGVFSHAVLKKPKKGEFRSQSVYGGTVSMFTPTAQQLLQAQAVLDRSPLEQPLAYARVDGTLIDGRLSLMELELIEPDLFLQYAPGAADRLAYTLLRRIVS